VVSSRIFFFFLSVFFHFLTPPSVYFLFLGFSLLGGFLMPLVPSLPFPSPNGFPSYSPQKTSPSSPPQGPARDGFKPPPFSPPKSSALPLLLPLAFSEPCAERSQKLFFFPSQSVDQPLRPPSPAPLLVVFPITHFPSSLDYIVTRWVHLF